MIFPFEICLSIALGVQIILTFFDSPTYNLYPLVNLIKHLSLWQPTTFPRISR